MLNKINIKTCKHPECINNFSHKGNKKYCSELCKKAHWYLIHRESQITKQLQYNKTEKGRESNRKYFQSEKGKKAQNKYQQANLEKLYAQRMARYYIKPQLCTISDCEKQGERHHDDYTKPLDVVFLCRDHHKALPSS